MLTTALLLGSLSLCSGEPSDSLNRLYGSGRPFKDFLAAATSRRETWHGNYGSAGVEPGGLERARRVPGKWRLLVVAEDWCGDSANTIPFIARLVDSLLNVELRIVDSKAGRWVMEGHPTPDGRPATPTVILLDEHGRDMGCFVERPLALQAWTLVEKPRVAESEWLEKKYAWYRADGGRETVREVVELLEAAAMGTPRCQRKP
ncbi:MAG: thioredoxin family protein [Gemmatimonadales bacterium]